MGKCIVVVLSAVVLLIAQTAIRHADYVNPMIGTCQKKYISIAPDIGMKTL